MAGNFFIEELQEMASRLYGGPPSIEFVEIAEIVDNSLTNSWP